MAALSPAELAGLIGRHFPDGIVPQTGERIRITAYAVARAESGGRPDAVGDAGQSFGLWQVYRPAHPQYSAAFLLNPDNNAAAALAISSGGRNWNPWCTWERTACGGAGNRRYLAYIGEARTALATAVAPPVNPPAASPPASSAMPWLLLGAGAAALLWYARR